MRTLDLFRDYYMCNLGYVILSKGNKGYYYYYYYYIIITIIIIFIIIIIIYYTDLEFLMDFMNIFLYSFFLNILLWLSFKLACIEMKDIVVFVGFCL